MLNLKKFFKWTVLPAIALSPAAFIACKKSSNDTTTSPARKSAETANLAKAPTQMIARISYVGESVKVNFVSIPQNSATNLAGSANLADAFATGQALKLNYNSGEWISSSAQKKDGTQLAGTKLYDDYPIYPTDPNAFPQANPAPTANPNQPNYLPNQQSYLPQQQNYQPQSQSYFPGQQNYVQTQDPNIYTNPQGQIYYGNPQGQIYQQYGANSGFGYGYSQQSGADFGFGLPFLRRITQGIFSHLAGRFNIGSIIQTVTSLFSRFQPYYYYGTQAVPYNYSGQNYQSGNSYYYQFQSQGGQNYNYGGPIQ